MKKFHIKFVAASVGVLVLVYAAVQMFTGLPWSRKTVIETLHDPTAIHSLRMDGLVGDGESLVRLRHVERFPLENHIFLSAVSEGVEMSADGSVVGLVEVHHWCGNDPIGKHIARVDLAALALYLGGEPNSDVPDLYKKLFPEPFTGERLDPGNMSHIAMIAEILDKVDAEGL